MAPRRTLPLLLTALFCTAADAHDGATGIVLERMENMKSMERVMKALREILLDDRPIDPVDLEAHVRALHRASQGIVAKFPETSADPHSHALPTVMERPEEFRRQATSLESSTEQLVRLASVPADRQQLIAATKVVGSVCQSCHEQFKKPGD
jgi:cytochrome c556